MTDIPEIPKQILEAASRGNLIIFVGAGVSRIIGCPSWNAFASLVLDDLTEKNIINYFENSELSKLPPRKILSICWEIYKENNLTPPDFKHIFKENEKLKEKYDIYAALYDFNAIYVTTNYDDQLDREANKGRPIRQAESSPEEPQGTVSEQIKVGKNIYREEDLLISNLVTGNVIHIHGSVNDQSKAIVTLADYMSKYAEREGKIQVFLNYIFSHYTVLFIGYGLDEYEILEFMISKLPKNERAISHYLLIPFFESQKNVINYQQKYYASFGIELIHYFIDRSGYSHLAGVIKEWAKEIGPISRPKTSLDKLGLIDEILK